MVVQHRFPLLLRKLDPETSISTPVPTRLFHRGSDYSHPRNLYSHARNPYSHTHGIFIHITPESVFTCPGIRTIQCTAPARANTPSEARRYPASLIHADDVVKPLPDTSLCFKTCVILRADNTSRLIEEYVRMFLCRYSSQRLPPEQLEFSSSAQGLGWKTSTPPSPP